MTTSFEIARPPACNGTAELAPSGAKPFVEFIEAGSRPLVVLVHSSLSGARQWSRLMDAMSGQFCLRAVNLYGYGRTPAWQGAQAPSLADFADLVLAALPVGARDVTLVGHSFGGAVAMQAASMRADAVTRLVLLEPSMFYLLDIAGRSAAFAEISALSVSMQRKIAEGSPAEAAEEFIGYWAGADAWAGLPDAKRAAFTSKVEPVLHEWNAVLAGTATPAQWAASLPKRSLVVSSQDSRRPSLEIVDVLSRTGAPWQFRSMPEGGHLAPITRPDLTDPIVAAFLGG